MPGVLHATGRWLGSLFRPVIGPWRLPAAVEDLRSRMAELETQSEKLANIVVVETDRLDSYLAYHAARVRDEIRCLSDELRRRPNAAYAISGLDAIVMTEGWDLIVPAEETGLLVYLLRHGLENIEPGVSRILRDRLKKGAMAVDVGANIGIHAVTMAHCIGEEGRLICFEPAPRIAHALKRTLNLNGCATQADVRQIALSDETGEAMFYRAIHGPMSSLFPLPSEQTCEQISVQTMTMDECIPPGTHIDLVKMDAEGAEPRIWRGMQRIVDDNPEIEIILEWSDTHFRRSGEDPVQFMKDIRSRGFMPYSIPGETVGEVTLLNGVPDREGKNLLLTRRARIASGGSAPLQDGAFVP